MSSIGEIKNLYSDSSRTKVLLPKTKTKAVSDDNGVGLDAILENMVHVGDVVEDTTTAPVDADSLAGLPADNYASKAFVTNAIANAQLGGDSGDIDLSGYATKDDLNTIDYPVDSVNGKTGAVQLSANDVGARPDTWTPTATDVGAIPNTWMPTAEQVGATPKEFHDNYAYNNGVMTNVQMINTNDPMGSNNKPYIVDHEESTASKWLRGVRKVFYTQPNEVVTATFGLRKDLTPALWFNRYKSGSSWLMDYQAHIVKESTVVPGCYYQITDGVEEWLNPPMALGNEYRLTERWRGEPVYVKLVDCGTLPNASTKEVSYSASNMKPIDYYGIYADQQVPMGNTGINLIVGKNKIVITTTSDMSTMTLQVVVKYCKT